MFIIIYLIVTTLGTLIWTLGHKEHFLFPTASILILTIFGFIIVPIKIVKLILDYE
jgi:hypothetical protein